MKISVACVCFVVYHMSRICQICGRGPRSAQSRSHSNIASKRITAINLQTKKIAGKKIRICAKCLKNKSK